ncbi:MAG: hypothetical protein IT200_16385 [Thermoleophilia bacterium]|nr:hypothetical protein [Thermoleophilia bacterium]
MPDLDDRIGRALRGLPDAAPNVRERVARRAGDLAPSPPRSMRGRRLALAGVAAAAVIGTGAALAGTGAIHVTVGSRTQPDARPASPQTGLSLPPRAHGIAVLAGGRLHLRTTGGVGIDGLRATAAEISPNALYVALGQRRSLTVLSPSGRRAWTQATAGPVVAVSWAPYPVWIGYLVILPDGRVQLRVIEGDGDHDRPVATGVARSRPYWSQDGTRLYFAQDGGWMTHTPSVGRTDRGGPCGESCGVAEPDRVRQLRREGAEQVGFSRTTDGAIWALRRNGAMEVWWGPTRPGGGKALLVMRGTSAPGRVQVSLR